MHSPLDKGLQTGLGVYFALCALMNVCFALYYHRYSAPRKKDIATIWYIVAGVFLLHAALYLAQFGLVIPRWFTGAIDWALNGNRGATIYVTLSVILFVVMVIYRRF